MDEYNDNVKQQLILP